VNQDPVIAWLKNKKSRLAMAKRLLAVASFFGGLVVLFITFWFTYAIIYVGVDGLSAAWQIVGGAKLKLSHEWRLVCSGLFLVLLFIQHLRTCPHYWTEVDFGELDPARALALRRLGGPAGALLASPRASAKLISDLLLSGPRLITNAWGLVVESRRLSRMDESGCAQLLLILASRHTATPYEELKAAGWEAWFNQMRLINGVVFLEKGLSVSSELKMELLQITQGQSNGN
jgi:hypothetical protein